MSIKSEIRDELDSRVEKQRLESVKEDMRRLGVLPKEKTEDDFSLGGFHGDF